MKKQNWKAQTYPYGQTQAIRYGIQKNEAVQLALSCGGPIQ
jgi:hypothetical protein